jgi:hypothetical protein
MLKRKDQDRHEKQRRHHLQKAAAEEVQHAAIRVPGTAHHEMVRG